MVLTNSEQNLTRLVIACKASFDLDFNKDDAGR